MGDILMDQLKSRAKLTRQSITQLTHSIRFKLVMWFVLILGAVMVTFSFFIYWRQVQDARSVALVRLNSTIEHALGDPNEVEHYAEGGRVIIPGTSGSDPVSIQEGTILALQASDGTILDSTGALSTALIQQIRFPAMGWNGVQQVQVPRSAAVVNNRYLFINQAIMANGQIMGYLLVGVPLDANGQLDRLLVSLIIGNIVMLSIALVGGMWLADRAMRPVKSITQTAQEIGETDLTKRLNMKGQDELSELGNTFDAMLDRIQAAFERQRQFTADASHELRTPLTIIDLETNRMLTGHRSAEEYEGVLRTINSENKFMIRLVTNLLTLARMDAGQTHIKFEPVDLSELASEVVERMEPLAKSAGVSLVMGDLPVVTVGGDRALLTQMLTNLVENAIKYSSSAVEPRVQVEAGSGIDNHRSLAWMRVSDNGIGIAAEHLVHLFDRFYQVEASRSRVERWEDGVKDRDSSGTGLGLAIAQSIARAHHGEIRVESTVGKGATFDVVLPEFGTREKTQ
jgi:signal transduction histidine kinase